MIALVMVAAACGNSESSGGSTTTADGTTAGTDGTATESTEKVAVDAPGVTDTEITVGGVASVTNPLGGKYDTADDGVQAYFEMVNSQGGVHGRKLVLNPTRDDKLSNNSAEVKGLIEQDDVFAVLPMASLLFTGADQLVAEGIPTFGWTINPEWQGTAENPKANLFGQARLLPVPRLRAALHPLPGQAGGPEQDRPARLRRPPVQRVRGGLGQVLHQVRRRGRRGGGVQGRVAQLRHHRPLGAGVQDEGRRGGHGGLLHRHQRRGDPGQGAQEAAGRRHPVPAQRLRPGTARRVRRPLRGVLRRTRPSPRWRPTPSPTG